MKHTIFFVLLFLSITISAQTKIKPPIDLVRFLKEKSSNLDVAQFDVTGDKVPEYFVTVKSDCGAGRCGTTLYQKKGNKYISLFESEVSLKVDYGKTKGMQNIYTQDWFADKYIYSHYRWNGLEYILFSCTEVVRYGKTKGTAAQVPCEEQ